MGCCVRRSREFEDQEGGAGGVSAVATSLGAKLRRELKL